MKSIITLLLITICLGQVACTTHPKRIAIGMFIGGLTGAAAGNQLLDHGAQNERQSQNTIVSSAVFALVTGGVIYWHYQAIEAAKVEISSRYARYRLCDPEEMGPELAKQLSLQPSGSSISYQLSESQIGKLSISLDDNTKWVYPAFRKRYLMPELSETQVVSKRYIWEIIKPGSFVTRSQNPLYFSEVEDK